jgi:hypothetical protein
MGGGVGVYNADSLRMVEGMMKEWSLRTRYFVGVVLIDLVRSSAC